VSGEGVIRGERDRTIRSARTWSASRSVSIVADLSYPSPWLWRLVTAADATVAVKRAKAAFIVPAQEGTNEKLILGLGQWMGS
jgi:hypothetical protein